MNVQGFCQPLEAIGVQSSRLGPVQGSDIELVWIDDAFEIEPFAVLPTAQL